jgi:CRP/FNR family transcriptional regulator
MIEFLKKLFNFNKTDDTIDYEFFSEVSVTTGLSKKEIRLFNDILIPKVFKKNEIIFRENHPQVVIYIIKTGKVKLYIDLPYEEVHISTVGAKGHFGDIGLFHDSNRLNSAMTLEDTDLFAIKKNDLKQFIVNNPGTGIKLLFNFGKSVADDLIETSKLYRPNETK